MEILRGSELERATKLVLVRSRDVGLWSKLVQMSIDQGIDWTPPCGTFSRAREIRRPGAPPPLRNLEHIRGFRDLTWTNKARLRSANLLTDFMARCCRQLSARGVCWSIENPSNSLIWHFPSVRTLIQDRVGVQFHACMWGSQRKKATSIVSNRSWFLPPQMRRPPPAPNGKRTAEAKKVFGSRLRLRNELCHRGL